MKEFSRQRLTADDYKKIKIKYNNVVKDDKHMKYQEAIEIAERNARRADLSHVGNSFWFFLLIRNLSNIPQY